MLCLDRYADHTSRETWDYSAWIRSYSAFLDERLEAFRWGARARCCWPPAAGAAPRTTLRAVRTHTLRRLAAAQDHAL